MITKDLLAKLDSKRKIFFISDTHFDHTNIIKYCNRPFKNVNEMNIAIVNKWNKFVREDDVVYFLGDMTYGKNHHAIDYWLSKLNGKIFFIRGNHDKDKITKAKELKDNYLLEYKEYKFLLIHNPDNKPKNFNDWIIHGDKHNHDLENYPFINGKRKSINVCAELLDYKPVDLDFILSLNINFINKIEKINSNVIR